MADPSGPAARLDEIRARDKQVAMGAVRDPEDVPRLVAAVGEILKRHHPDDQTGWCAHDGFSWPCEDYRDVSRALLGDDAPGPAEVTEPVHGGMWQNRCGRGCGWHGSHWHSREVAAAALPSEASSHACAVAPNA